MKKLLFFISLFTFIQSISIFCAEEKKKEEVVERERAGKFKVGVALLNGKKHEFKYTEDAYSFVPEKNLFAVYDGHDGDAVAKFLAHAIPAKIDYSKLSPESLTKEFKDVQEEIEKNPELVNAGSTATVAIIKDGKIYVANIGDSRAVLSINGVAKPLSIDQKPYTNTEEKKRLEKLGAEVFAEEEEGKLLEGFRTPQGHETFNISRDFGYPGEAEFAYLVKIMYPIPEVTIHEIGKDDQFFILASDGVWDVMKNEEAVKIVNDSLSKDGDFQKAADQLAKVALNKEKSDDDITVLIVGLK